MYIYKDLKDSEPRDIPGALWVGMEYFGDQSRKGEPSFRNDQDLMIRVQSTD